MKYSFILALLLTSLFSSLAIGADFTGTWSIDLRSDEEKKTNVECGTAYFSLTQLADNTVVGTHGFTTAGCGRLSESPVEGTAKGSTAILVVTSDRNGAVFKGKAILKEGKLYWNVIKQLSPGDTFDEGLILNKGILEIEK